MTAVISVPPFHRQSGGMRSGGEASVAAAAAAEAEQQRRQQVSAIEEIRYVVRKQELELEELRQRLRDNVSMRRMNTRTPSRRITILYRTLLLQPCSTRWTPSWPARRCSGRPGSGPSSRYVVKGTWLPEISINAHAEPRGGDDQSQV